MNSYRPRLGKEVNFADFLVRKIKIGSGWLS